jgi:hypothetical protein
VRRALTTGLGLALVLSGCSDDDGGGGSWPPQLYLSPLGNSELALQLVELEPGNF